MPTATYDPLTIQEAPAVADSLGGMSSMSLEDMQRSAQNMIRGGKKAIGKVIYYQKPPRWADGRLNVEANWVYWAEAQQDVQLQAMAQGSRPLEFLGSVDPQGDPHAALYGQWARILLHPKGPELFPVDQLLTYRWYDPEKLPLPQFTPCEAEIAKETYCGQIHRISFPQLRGVEITEIPCPDCKDRIFFEPIHLAWHLRNQHNYERVDLMALGELMGVSFERVFANAAAPRTFRIGGRAAEGVQRNMAEPEPEPSRATVAQWKPPSRDELRAQAAAKPEPQPDGTPGSFGRVWLGGKQVKRATYEKALAGVAA